MLHLGQDDLPVPCARQIVGPSADRPVHPRAGPGRAAAVEPGVDYFCAGPLLADPDQARPPGPGPGPGPHRGRRAPAGPGSRSAGSTRDRLDEVLAAGATRVVVVRAITEADDPQAAARSLAARLRA